MLRPVLSALTAAIAIGLSTAALAAPVHLDLPAQPLASSLDQLGKATGLRVVFDPQAVAGKQAPTVRGDLEAGQALQQLLAGTGLTASIEGNSARIVQAQQGPVTLAGVDINAEAGVAGMATTEGTQSYTTGSMNTATKLNLSDPRDAAVGERDHPQAHGRPGHERPQ